MYSKKQIAKALGKYDKTGSIATTIITLGHPSRTNLHRWIKNRNHPQKEKKKTRKASTPEHPWHPSVKLEVIHRYFESGENIKLVSEEVGYSQANIYA